MVKKKQPSARFFFSRMANFFADYLLDDTWHLIASFLPISEIYAWYAIAVQTTDEDMVDFFRCLCRRAKPSSKTIPTTDRLWSDKNMLDIAKEGHRSRFNNIDFESAVFWFEHANPYQNKTVRLEMERIANALSLGNQSRTQLVGIICNLFFGNCTFRNRVYVQRRFLKICCYDESECHFIQCPCHEKEEHVYKFC